MRPAMPLKLMRCHRASDLQPAAARCSVRDPLLDMAAHLSLCCVAAAIAARANYTDRDFVDFLVNVECLEGQFDTWGTFGHGFLGECTPCRLLSDAGCLVGCKSVLPVVEQGPCVQQCHLCSWVAAVRLCSLQWGRSCCLSQ